MSSLIKFAPKIAVTLSLAAALTPAIADYPGVGRHATPKEIAAWDIDVRPGFKGLPKGSGSVSLGQKVWDDTCASCHGTFGELNEVFTPIVGGTTKEDMASGRVASLKGNRQPQRTTLMKVPTISTLWDYINRAMPWTAPKSLTVDEVYGVTAYILNLADIVPDDYVLSDKNIAEAQQLMPNRNGMTTDHGMRDVGGKPDIASVACMKDCAAEVSIRSTLPDVARPAHGNLQQQNRSFGAVRGANTLEPPLSRPVGDARRNTLAMASKSVDAGKQAAPDAATLAKQMACLACHGIANKIVGPALTDVAARYKNQAGIDKQLAERIRHGGSGNWGSTPMPAQTQPTDEQLALLVKWILNGAK